MTHGRPHLTTVRPARRRPAARSRSAFTLIEVLIVIGVIALLAAIAVIGFKVVGGVSKDRVTTLSLENCQNMSTEYKLTQTADSLLSSDIVTAQCNSPYRWQPPANGQPYDVLNAAVMAPDFPNTGGTAPDALPQRELHARYLQDETARVIQRLTRVPANRTAIEATPPDRLVRIKFPVDPTQTLSTTASPPEYPNTVNTVDGINLLDGSHQPIYFIPGGGIYNVLIGYHGTGDKADPKNYDRQMAVRAPDHQPFWASPGPDGDLSTGDDNIYSFDR